MLKPFTILPAVILCIGVMSLSVADAEARGYKPTCNLQCSTSNGYDYGRNQLADCVITVCTFDETGPNITCDRVTTQPFPVKNPRSNRSQFCEKINDYFRKKMSSSSALGAVAQSLPKTCTITLNNRPAHKPCPVNPIQKPKKPSKPMAGDEFIGQPQTTRDKPHWTDRYALFPDVMSKAKPTK